MTILIVEDEEATARKLQRLLARVDPTVTVVGPVGSVEQAVAWLNVHGSASPTAPDLILMDIELADGQSFEIFNRVVVTSPVIFTTAYDEFALKAFQVNSIDYLLKPVKEADLRRALDKLQRLRQVLTSQPGQLQASLADLLRQIQQQPLVSGLLSAPAASGQSPNPELPVRDRFLVKQGQRLLSVPTGEIMYFFVRNKMTFLRAIDGREWLVEHTLDELEQLLDPHRFFRLNRQLMAELRAIERVNLYFNGKLKITLQPAYSEEVLVSREKAGEFKRWFGI